MTIALMGGVANSLLNFRGDLIKDLVSKGNRVYAIAPDYSAKTLECVSRIGAVPIRHGFSRGGLNPARDLIDCFILSRVLASINADIYIGYTIKPATFGVFAAWFAGIESRFVIITGLGVASYDTNFTRWWVGYLAKWLHRLSMYLCKGVIFQNSDDLEWFKLQKIVGKVPVRVVGGSGVNLLRYRVSALQIEPFVFMMVSRIFREKGIYEFIEAARVIKKRHPHVEFHLVGTPDEIHEAPSIQQINSWVREGIITYKGWVEDITKVLEEATVVVLPSYREGVPRTLLEAMAMARPIITTDVPGCRDTVIDGRNGWLVRKQDYQSLVQAMIYAIGNPKALHGIGLEGRKLADERFNVNNVNRVIILFLGC